MDRNLLNPVWRLENLYLIKDKKARISQLKLNRVQKILLARILPAIESGGAVEDDVLKFRQGGVSTFYLLLHLDRTVFTDNITTGILADLKENLGYLFEMIRFAHESMPGELRPKLGSDSKSELTFPARRSKIMVSLAFKSTTLHGLHVSERAYIDPDNLKRTLAACAPGAWKTTETTANGFNQFRKEWIEKPGVFLPWPLQDEYRIPALGLPDELPPVERTDREQALAARVLRTYGLEMDDRQFRYRREKKTELGNLFAQEMAETEEECFLASGGAFFNGAKITVLLKEAKEVKPLTSTAEWKVWEKPTNRHVYVIGADVAEGGEGDYSVMAGLCVTCRKTAFRYRARCGLDWFYKTLHKTGIEYNRCVVAPENNAMGAAVIMGLSENNYPNLYRPERRVRPLTAASTLELPKFGWTTTAKNKHLILEHLKLALEGNSEEDEQNFEPSLVWLDVEFLEETLSVRDEAGKISAKAGEHDDMVMAYAIAWQMARRESGRLSRSVLGGIRLGDSLESA